MVTDLQETQKYTAVVPLKRFVLPIIGLLSACAPATAQLQVTTPTAARCAENTTLTPVVGIALEGSFGGVDGYRHADDLKNALKIAGFRVTDLYHVDLLDRASIKISGRIDNWQNVYGDVSRSRIGKVDLDVTDLSTKDVLFTISQPSARAVFQAITFEQLNQQLVEELSKHFCQMN